MGRWARATCARRTASRWRCASSTSPSFDVATLAMELALPAWQELGVDVELQGVDQAQFNTIAFETGAWDVVPLRPRTSTCRASSSRSSPVRSRPTASTSRRSPTPTTTSSSPRRATLTGPGGMRAVERSRGGALRPDEHPPVRRQHACRRSARAPSSTSAGSGSSAQPFASWRASPSLTEALGVTSTSRSRGVSRHDEKRRDGGPGIPGRRS